MERRDGAKTTRLSPWTRHAAITPHPDGNETARYVLRIETEAAQPAFLVNGTRVLE